MVGEANSTPLESLAERERQLRMVAENIPGMVAYFDHELRCRFANQRYCEFQGVARERILGMRLAEILDAEALRANREGIERVLRGEQHTDRLRWRRRSGEVRDVEVRRVPHLGPNNRFLGYFALLIDVTEQVAAEARVRASEARLRAILENEPECVKVISPDGALLEINRAGLEMLEAESLEQVQARGLESFVAPEHRQRFAEFLERVLHGERGASEFEIVGLRGARRWLESLATPMPLEQGQGVLTVTRDITARKAAEARAEYLAHHDALTGLPNRELFGDRLELAVAHARRRGEALGAVIVGLDRFGQFNESLGSDMGDELLRAVAKRLQGALREVDTIARVGGDQFGILVEAIADAGAVTPVAQKIMAAFAAPFELLGRELFVSASVGVAVYSGVQSPHGVPDALMENAASAMAQAKHEGGGSYQVFVPQFAIAGGGRLELESELRHALEKGELELHYQPKVRLRGGQVTGAEALLRWRSPRRGLVSPAQFIPVAEESGLILPIGAWVLRSACAQAAAWRAAGRPLAVAVNLSPRQFRQRALAREVGAALDAAGLPPELLELEITEGTAMTQAEHAVAILLELHGIGVRLAVDDFGTGYSSLGYLQRFPLDAVKIDRGFVRDIVRRHGDEAIVRATVALGHSLKLRVIAEGIETAQQQALLARTGCDEGQGFLYSPALPAADFEALVVQPPWSKRAPRRARRKPRKRR